MAFFQTSEDERCNGVQIEQQAFDITEDSILTNINGHSWKENDG